MLNVTCTGGPCGAFPLLPTFLGSNMVLQRAPQRAALWGRGAVVGETVTATLRDAPASSSTATVDGSGAWSLSLPPQPASTGLTLAVHFSATGRSSVLTNVAFGDVYLCSGQVRPLLTSLLTD